MTAPSVPAGDVAKLVEELRAGLDGVTPGPWQSEQPSWDDETDDADECPRYVASVVATVDDVSAVARLRCDQRADAAHIARCSPDNIAKLLVENARLSRDLAEARADNENLSKALIKINAIRNSIIGFQNVGWSDHIYPLVAALHDAGFEGAGYDAARAEIRTMLAAEARVTELEAALEPIAEALDGCDDDKAGDGAHIWEAPVAMNLTYGDLRRARSVLSTQPKETPDVA